MYEGRSSLVINKV